MRLAAALAFALASSLFADLALAEPAANGVALRTFEEGRRLFEKGAFEEALRAFSASLEVQPSPNTRLYVGRCLRRLGKIATAHAALRLASREAEERVTAGDPRYAPTQTTAAREAAEIAPLVPSLTVRVVASDGGAVAEAAQLTVDGRAIPRGAWALPFDLDPGAHEVKLSGPRVEPFHARVELAESEKKSLDIIAKHAATGVLVVRLGAKPMGLSVVIDGRPVDATSLDAPRDVPAGAHRLEARAPGYRTHVWEGSIGDGAEVTVPVSFVPDVTTRSPESAEPRSRGTPRWLFYTTAGAAVVALGTGAGLVAHASSRDDEEQTKAATQRDPSTREAIRTEALAGSFVLAAGAILGVSAGVLGFSTRWKDGSRTGFVVAPSGSGIVVRGDL